jgi:uncharacterized protein (DUF1684 family)
LSGGQTKQFTSTLGFKVFAKFLKYPNRTFLHGLSYFPPDPNLRFELTLDEHEEKKIIVATSKGGEREFILVEC